MPSVQLPTISRGTKAGNIYADDPLAGRIMGTYEPTRPRGTRSAPALTCKQLGEYNKNLPDDYYWIDPNGNEINDVVQAYCKFKTSETCIRLKQKVSNSNYRENENSTEQEEREGNNLGNQFYKLTYELEGSQLEFLKRQSLIGKQEIYEECTKSNERSLLITQPITLFTDSGNELTYGHPYLGYEIVQNTCHVSSELKKTALLIKGKTNQFPIRGIQLFNTKILHNSFQIGEVCFQ
uniref:Fibrillar collagen NC1 domain-containing protein n=1 Tax=Schistosoma japonicum TaxID=6182 RepID=Q5C0K3_SCHJA|nr:unknown [Schistosoma japonicum]